MTGHLPSPRRTTGWTLMAFLGCLSLLPSGLDAQGGEGPWIGAGVGGVLRFDDPQGILSDRFGPGGYVRAGYSFSGGMGIGAEWSGMRIATSVSPLNRQTFAVVAFRPIGPEGGSHLKLGVGMGLSTLIEVEPPPADGEGDAAVSIGRVGGLALTAGFSSRVEARPGVAVVPGIDLHVHRMEGSGTTTLVASVGVILGRGGPGR